MVIVCAGMLMAGQAVQYDAAFSERLLKWRAQFDEVLEEPKADLGYLRIYSETLGPAHSDALYPIGSAAERFIINYSYVIHQVRRGQKTVVDWYVPIVEVNKRRAVKGTLPKYLMSQGYAISPKAKMTSKVRKAMEANYVLTCFFYHHIMGGYANIIKSDGSCLPIHKSNDMYSILPEENDLLKQKSKGH